MEEMVTGSEISDFFSAAESGRGCWCAAGEWSSNYFECFCQQQIEECSHSPFSCQSFGHHNLLLVPRNWEQLHHWPVLDPQADFHLFLCSKWTWKNLVCSCGDTQEEEFWEALENCWNGSNVQFLYPNEAVAKWVNQFVGNSCPCYHSMIWSISTEGTEKSLFPLKHC